MRIVAGTLRGRSIAAPEGEGTRPTIDRVREALFSSLYSLRGGFEGAIVLDAFAGSGALGIEAISRGAAEALFYESSGKAAATLKRNLEACNLAKNVARLVKRDVLTAPPLNESLVFDLVFLDPPYEYDAHSVCAMVRALSEAGSLADDALIVYEHALASHDAVRAAGEDAGFVVRQTKKYGKVGVTILGRPAEVHTANERERSAI